MLNLDNIKFSILVMTNIAANSEKGRSNLIEKGT